MRQAALLLLLSAAAGAARDGEIRGPVTAIVFDEASRSIRPILGVPGAAHFGSPLRSDLEQAKVSPDNSAALAVRAAELLLLRFDGAGDDRTLARGAVTAMAWSRSADAAAAVVDNRLLVWRRGEAEASLLGSLAGECIALAVAAGGRHVYAAVAGPQGAIVRYAPGEPERVLAAVADPAGLALTPDGAALYTVDRFAGHLLEIATEGGATLRAADLQRAVGITLSRDGSWILVTQAEPGSVAIFERKSHWLRARLEVGFTPSRLEAAGETDVFVLNRRARKEPLEILAFQPEPASYFVPALEEE